MSLRNAPYSVIYRSLKSTYWLTFVLTGCDSHTRSIAQIDAECPPSYFCESDVVVELPTVVTLHVTSKSERPNDRLLSYVTKEFHDRMIVFDIGPQKAVEWTDSYGRQHRPSRAYFLAKTVMSTSGKLLIVFDHLPNDRAVIQTISKAFDRYKTHINVLGSPDGTVSLDEIALVNNATGVGQTFIRSFEKTGNLERGQYIRHDYGSKFDKSEFYHGYKACFSPPRLVQVPQSWTDAASKRALVCEKRRDTMKKRPWYSQFFEH